MLSELSQQLEQAIEQHRLKRKLERDLRTVEHELQTKTVQVESLKNQLEKEQVDVTKLERTSLTSLFYSVLGSREQQLEEERQEMLAAQLQYQQAKRQLEFLEQDQAYLQRQLVELEGIEAKYNALLAQKEQLIQQSGGTAAKALFEVTEQIAQQKNELKELSEAIAAGEQVITALQQTIAALESAEGWGTWDLLGGGLLSTAVKHSRIDEARQTIQQVQGKMNRFQRELADIRTQVNLQIDIGHFESFADYFFDGLIMDWIVQSKISDSLARARQAKASISRAVKQLEQRRKQTQNHEQTLKEKRTQIIEEA